MKAQSTSTVTIIMAIGAPGKKLIRSATVKEQNSLIGPIYIKDKHKIVVRAELDVRVGRKVD